MFQKEIHCDCSGSGSCKLVCTFQADSGVPLRNNTLWSWLQNYTHEFASFNNEFQQGRLGTWARSDILEIDAWIACTGASLFLAPLAALFLLYAMPNIAQCLALLKNLDTKSDFWDLRSWKQKYQNFSLFLWCQDSMAPLHCVWSLPK